VQAGRGTVECARGTQCGSPSGRHGRHTAFTTSAGSAAAPPAATRRKRPALRPASTGRHRPRGEPPRRHRQRQRAAGCGRGGGDEGAPGLPAPLQGPPAPQAQRRRGSARERTARSERARGVPPPARQGRPRRDRGGRAARAAALRRGGTSTHAGGRHPAHRRRGGPARVPGDAGAGPLTRRGRHGLRRGRPPHRLRERVLDAPGAPSAGPDRDLRRSRARPGPVQPARHRAVPTRVRCRGRGAAAGRGGRLRPPALGAPPAARGARRERRACPARARNGADPVRTGSRPARLPRGAARRVARARAASGDALRARGPCRRSPARDPAARGPHLSAPRAPARGPAPGATRGRPRAGRAR